MTTEPTPLSGQIITADASTAPGAPGEPMLTLSQLQALLTAAADYERAQRPIVIYQAAPAPAPQPAPQPGASLALPPTEPTGTAGTARRGWGVRLAYASVATLLAGAAEGVVTGTEPLPVLLCALGILGTIGGTARALTEERQGRA